MLAVQNRLQSHKVSQGTKPTSRRMRLTTLASRTAITVAVEIMASFSAMRIVQFFVALSMVVLLQVSLVLAAAVDTDVVGDANAVLSMVAVRAGNLSPFNFRFAGY